MGTQRSVRENRLGVRLFHMITVVVCSGLLVAIPLHAQLATGTILGVVRDASGGVVPGATVTIVNVGTGQSRTTTSGDDGAYRVPAMPVGHYNVKVEKEGFKTETQQGLVLDVLQELVVNAPLQVGTSAQEVVVTGEVPLVNTTSSSLGGLVDEQRMAELPLNGRNYMDLSLMQPGIARNTAMGSSHGTTGVWYSSNGAPTRSNMVSLDGANMMTLLGGAATGEGGTTLGVDGIREYKVVTTSFGAEYGQSMGSQMLMVSKSGTNQWHGDVFEYFRNAALDARNFFDYQYTVPSSGIKRLPPFQRNNFGASFGGPIRKEKTFFYTVYEGLRQNLGFTALDNVPIDACRGTGAAVAGEVVWNGSGAQPAGSIGPCIPLGANPSGPGTNSVTLKAVMVPFLNLYPHGNIAGSSSNYTFPATNRLNVNYGQIRADHTFSAMDSLFGRYTADDTTLHNAQTAVGDSSSGAAFPEFGTDARSRNQFLTLAENHIFSSTLLNTTRLSFSRTADTIANTYTPLNPGDPPLNSPQYQLISGLPVGIVNITGFSTLGGQSGYGPPDDSQIQSVYTLSDDVFYTRGKHALKLGLLVNRYNQGMTGALRNESQINFSGLAGFFNAQTNTNGYIGHKPISPTDANRYYLFSTIGMYAQDDWRVTSKLTLNLGLRYEFMTTPYESNNRSYVIRNILRDSASTQGPPFRNYTLHNFSPRVGFALDPTGSGKMSIRGAFGIYYDVGNVGVTLEQALLGTPPLVNTCTVSSGKVTVPLDFSAGNCATLFTNQYAANQPSTLQYNLTVERRLPGNLGLTVSYVGMRGTHLYTNREGNPVTAAYNVNGTEFWTTNTLGTALVLNPTTGAITSSTVTSCSNVVPSCRNNPNFAGTQFVTTSGDAWYNSLQVVLNKRLSRGLEFTSSYTWAKNLDTTTANMDGNDCGSGGATGFDPQFPHNDKGPACYDIGQNWRFNLLYHLPILKASGVLSKIANGWWIGNIVSVQTGYPFTPLLTVNRSSSGVFQGLTGQGDRPNIVTANATGTGKAAGLNFVAFDPKTVITGNPNQWFNPLMFDLPPIQLCPGATTTPYCGQLGNVSRGFLRAPGLGNWDFSIVKDTKLGFLGEQGSLQFRTEFFNLLNRANFGFPSTGTYAGTVTDVGANSEIPTGTAGQITTTATKSRQIQLALKIIF